MSAQAEHTPGPWAVLPPDSSRPSQVIVYARSGAEIYKAPLTAETEANARLIAAAPDLLAALIAARHQLIAVQAVPALEDHRATIRRAISLADAAVDGVVR
jgi:hypothetical protein